MKSIFSMLIISVLIFNTHLTAQENNQKSNAGTLIITVDGMSSDKGEVQIGLFQSEKSYDGKEPKLKGKILKVSGLKAVWTIENLPFGRYAVKVYHDENSNDNLDTNFFGLPTEKYGFSNNAGGMFGTPSFEDASFTFDKDTLQIKITVK